MHPEWFAELTQAVLEYGPFNKFRQFQLLPPKTSAGLTMVQVVHMHHGL